MSSHSVPRATSSGRSSHQNRIRTSHDYDAYATGLGGGTAAGEQYARDNADTPVVISPDGSTPGYAVTYPPAAASPPDTTVPGLPTGLSLNSDVAPDADGKHVLRMLVSIVHPTLNVDTSAITDLFGTYVEITGDNSGEDDPSLWVPVWTNSTAILIGKDVTSSSILGVRGITKYWARARSVDASGNFGAYCASVTHTTGRDADAPSSPQGFTVAAGFKGIGVHWAPSISSDLMIAEVRYAPDNGTGTAPNTSQWQSLRVRTNTVWIDGLTVGTKYWAQARAVDFSGNVVTSEADATPVDWLQNPESGWCGLLSATPVAVGAADVAFNSVITNILAANKIDASTITAGTLKLNLSDANMADGIRFYASNKCIAYWDETGLYVGTLANGLPITGADVLGDLSATSYVRLTDAGLTVYSAGVAQSAITTAGINATAINFGTLPGGHNLLQNSSFELADFIGAPTLATWDVAADWTATQLSNVNATNGAGSVTQTAGTY